MRRALLFLASMLMPLAATPAAEQDYSGTTPSGAYYRIAVPAGWQPGGPLVLYQHGFNFSAAGGPPSLGPLQSVMLGEGYAVAASSYSQRGWALFRAIDDNRELVQTFTSMVGAPGEIVPFGGSEGGLIALKLAETPALPPVRGVYALCPAAAGARAWDRAIDLRLAYDVVCNGAGSLPTGDQPLPWALNLDDIPDDLGDLGDKIDVLQALLPLNQCTGVNLPSYLRNGAMQRRLNQLMAFSGISDENFFVTNMAYAIFAMSDVVRAPDKLDGTNPFITAGVAYADPAIAAQIARIEADPLAAFEFQWVSDFRGDVGAAKVLSLQTSRDQLVIPANQDFIRKVLPADQLTSAIVDETSPTHCGFTQAEGIAGWEALRAWKSGAPQPGVADVQAACQTLVANGTPGPCRLDPDATYASFDSVVPPRPVSTAAPVDRRYTGEWYDPTRSGEGFYIEVLDATHAVVTFYTYPPAGGAGTQAFLFGVGTIEGNGIAVDPLLLPTRDESTNTLVNQLWGRLYLSFGDCGDASVRWEGPPAWGRRDGSLVRLTSIQGLGCAAPADATANDDLSGSWMVQGSPGYGISLERIDATHLAVSWNHESAAASYWYGGLLAQQADGSYSGQIYITGGTNFGAAFDPAAVTRNAVGTLAIRLACPQLQGTLSLNGAAPWTFQFVRLTAPLGVGTACGAP